MKKVLLVCLAVLIGIAFVSTASAQSSATRDTNTSFSPAMNDRNSSSYPANDRNSSSYPASDRNTSSSSGMSDRNTSSSPSVSDNNYRNLESQDSGVRGEVRNMDMEQR